LSVRLSITERKGREEKKAEQSRTAEDLPSKYAVLKILPFPTAYLCEAGFSMYGQQNINIVTHLM
jgi:hypothetical protein